MLRMGCIIGPALEDFSAYHIDETSVCIHTVLSGHSLLHLQSMGVEKG